MLKDLNDLQQPGTLQADVCVVGAGPAGLTLAMQLSDLGRRVVLLEAGGLQFPEAREQALYSGEVGAGEYPLAASRLRYFGGTSNHWGGWCRPLDAIDFEARPHTPLSGWPIERRELDVHYRRAAEVCQIPNYEALQAVANERPEGLLDDSDGVLRNRYFVFSPPTRFGPVYTSRMETDARIQCLLHANATELIVQQRRVLGVRAQSLQGQRVRVEAEHTVLAMGGIENARFLLNQQPPGFSRGVGNESDWVGRCFMDHPGHAAAQFLLPAGLNYRRIEHRGAALMPVLGLSDEVLRREGLNNFCVLLSAIRNESMLGKNYAHNPWLQQQANLYNSTWIFEPTPCRDSRVTLNEEVDALGLRKLRLDWRFNPSDFTTLDRAVKLFAEALGVRGLGRVRSQKLPLNPDALPGLSPGFHHGGTTRMSVGPEEGVVDVNLKVHDCTGLHVLSNGVFPSVGFSNPTLTIVALALRLGHHLHGGLS